MTEWITVSDDEDNISLCELATVSIPLESALGMELVKPFTFALSKDPIIERSKLNRELSELEFGLQTKGVTLEQERKYISEIRKVKKKLERPVWVCHGINGGKYALLDLPEERVKVEEVKIKKYFLEGKYDIKFGDGGAKIYLTPDVRSYEVRKVVEDKVGEKCYLLRRRDRKNRADMWVCDSEIGVADGFRPLTPPTKVLTYLKPVKEFKIPRRRN